MIHHVHVITSEGRVLPRNYVLGMMAKCWEDQGIKVTAGPTNNLDADVDILHINATWVPASCLPANPLGRKIINAKILDISKRRISKNILNQDTSYAGPIIIKTDANCFGTHESKQLPFWNPKRLRRKLARILPWQIARELPRGVYPILNSVAEVPNWVWSRNDLVVERFQPEIENGEYVLRSWLFFGDQEYAVKVYCPEPIVKAGKASHYEYLDSIPESLRTVRAQLEMDFGKFDYVVVDGEAILLDVNKTPTTTATETPSANLLRMASGIKHFADMGK